MNYQRKQGNKGFYITLFICALAIGATAFFSFQSVGPRVENVDLTPAQELKLSTPKVVAAMPTPTIIPEAEPIQEVSINKEGDATLVNTVPRVFVPPTMGRISVPYSTDQPVFSNTYQDWRIHKGIDISAKKGEQVLAVSDGVIEQTYLDEELGKTIIIDHGDGIKSLYGNLSTETLVHEGQEVLTGDVISGIGDSSSAEALQEAHLHFELIRDGENIDPATLIPFPGDVPDIEE